MGAVTRLVRCLHWRRVSADQGESNADDSRSRTGENWEGSLMSPSQAKAAFSRDTPDPRGRPCCSLVQSEALVA